MIKHCLSGLKTEDTGLGINNRKKESHSQSNAHMCPERRFPGVEPLSLSGAHDRLLPTPLSPGVACPHARNKEASGWVPWNSKGSLSAQLAGSVAGRLPSSGCGPAREQNAREGLLKTGQCLELLLQTYGPETHRGGVCKEGR